VIASAGGARLLDGEAVARAMREEVARDCARLAASRGIVPGLAVVLAGDDPASAIYVRNKQRAARDAGMRSSVERLPASVSHATLLDTVRRLNADPQVHGILIQLPLPAAIDARAVLEAVEPAKDVDGFHPLNAGRLRAGAPGFVPCTPAGILELLRRSGIEREGREAVVVGRSAIVGTPMALLLLHEHCTVTVCHSRTRDLASVTSRADILIAAAGRRGLIGGAHIKPGAAVIDVGIHRVEDEATCRTLYGDDAARLAALRERGVTLCGDVRPLEARRVAGWLSPVPGGVGPLTIAQLLRNTVRAAMAALPERDG
jgi:methylenetetrahydrofolate dehydrogenase (NADP+)/methenyltetrahydrofolate cyclohydrolase